MMGMDPRQMKRMMSQMGIDSVELAAKRVVIETESENIIIENPQVTQIKMQGELSYQVSGKVTKESAVTEDDVKLVAEQTGASEDDARKAIDECKGDIAAAIMKLKKD